MKKAFSARLDEELIEKLKKISEETMIPQTKLLEIALKEVIERYSKK